MERRGLLQRAVAASAGVVALVLPRKADTAVVVAADKMYSPMDVLAMNRIANEVAASVQDEIDREHEPYRWEQLYRRDGRLYRLANYMDTPSDFDEWLDAELEKQK